jgi:MFS family permease
LFSAIFTSLYFVGLAFCRNWYAFFFIQILRTGYQLDSTTEMYLATITTERERTSALMVLTIPQALSMLLAPVVASNVAAVSTMRISQIICGIVLGSLLIPVLIFLLPTTHSIPRLASARLRPQEYWPLIGKNSALREGLLLRTLIIAAYVCYELIARNFLLRAFTNWHSDPNAMAEVVITMGISLLITQFLVLPVLQKRFSPKALLLSALGLLAIAYLAAAFVTTFAEYLAIVALQTAGYAVAYAESSTQITTAVEVNELGKATGFAAMIQWISHMIIPIYTSHLVDHWHYSYAFYTSSVLMAITFVYISLFARATNARLRTLLPNLVVT